MSAQLRSTSHGKTLVLTLSNAEQQNALTPAMMAAGVEALNVAERNAEISAVVLSGEGPHFCTGLAPQSSGDAAYDDPANLALFRQWLETLRTFPKPIVAALEGKVHDEGLLLALACDLVIAATDCKLSATLLASRPAPLETHAALLARRLPPTLTFELLTCPTAIAPHRLHALGLVNQISATGQAHAASLELADRYAAAPSGQVMRIKDFLAELGAGSLTL
jgi:enoyl-CoA hydratase/carnithine racemase